MKRKDLLSQEIVTAAIEVHEIPGRDYSSRFTKDVCAVNSGRGKSPVSGR